MNERNPVSGRGHSDKAIEELLKAALPGLSDGRLRFHESMRKWTTFQTGGYADAVFFPESDEEIRSALTLCRQTGIPATVLGKGSNVVVSDAGIRGLTVFFAKEFSKVNMVPESDGSHTVTAEAGALLASVAGRCAAAGLTGMEFATGIPGTVGGAVYMNAGAYDGSMADVVVSSDVLDGDFGFRTISCDEHRFAYRHSVLMENHSVVLRTRLALRAGDPETIRSRIRELAARRRASQPLDLPSAGSTFKRPPDEFAGRLITECGLRGFRIGDAQVSEKHAGFIVNRGAATASDIRRLVQTVARRVYDQRGVRLEPEVRFIGDWNEWEPDKEQGRSGWTGG